MPFYQDFQMKPTPLFCALILSPAAFAQSTPPAELEQRLERCALLGDPTARLGCYDALANRPQPTDPDTAAAAAAGVPGADKGRDTHSGAFPGGPVGGLVQTDGSKSPAAPEPEVSRMIPLWELDAASKRGVFNFRPHRDNYLLLVNYSNSTNDTPFEDFTPAGLKSKHVELSYQLSFKMKMLEGIGQSPFDLWFGYTQQSFWQAYNRSASSPFRETNYQPEIMATAPIDKHLGDLAIRYVTFGGVHQSNGQTSTLSRSWNRLYAEVGAEYGKLAIAARVWKRLDNAKSDNDNIDITDFMGNGDLKLSYRSDGHEYSMLARRNFGKKHGAVQLGWAFPLRDNLKGYTQFFSGYGQSLIDYNYSQMSLGAGFLIDF